MRTIVIILAIVPAMVLGIAVGADNNVDENLQRAISFLSPDGEYLPQFGWGVESGSPGDGLVIGEPLASMCFRAALNGNTSLVSSEGVANRRLANLAHAWTTAAASKDYKAAMSVLSANVRTAVEQGVDGSLAVYQVLQTNPQLACRLTIRELPMDRPCGATPSSVMDRKCFDDDYYIVNIWPITICKQNGQNCTVEVDCSQGNSVHFESRH